MDPNTRLQQIPVIHVRGTYYMCGFSVGRQFRSVITELINNWEYVNKTLIPAYETSRGKEIYEQSLTLCQKKFPMYVKELEGVADGAQVPFHKLFLLHIDTIVVPIADDKDIAAARGNTGCTTIMSNNDKVIIGHTEDAYPDILNNIYVIYAEILNDSGVRVEKFGALTYAGNLPGYSMGFNEHGLVYSINSLFPKDVMPDRTPKAFLTRALLKTANFSEVVDLLRDTGCGTSDGFSVNVTFAKQDGSPVMHNIEVGPPSKDTIKESELSALTLTHGDFHVHCNKYLRLKLLEGCEVATESSTHRHKRIGRYLRPNTEDRIKEILSDHSDSDYPIFRHGNSLPDFIKTVAVGIFDVTNRKWELYIDPPHTSEPVAIMNLEF